LGQKQYPSASVRYLASARAEVFQCSFLFLSSSSVFQLGSGSGRKIFKFPNIAKPYRCTKQIRKCGKPNNILKSLFENLQLFKLKNLVTIFIFLSPTFCIGQKKAEKLYDKAYDYSWQYHYKNNDTTKLYKPYYDSAIYFANILREKYPNYRTENVDELLQDSYFGNEEYSKSLEYSMKILERYKIGIDRPEDISVESIFACKKAAQSFLKIGEFKKCILYYDSCSTKYKGNYLQCGIGVMIDNAYRNKDLFFAYLGLKETEKALEIATPYFFDSTMTEFIDSIYSKNYFDAVSTMFTKDEAKQKIINSIDSLNTKMTNLYNASKDKLPKDNSVHLFGGKIDFLNEFPIELYVEAFKDSYTKEYLLNRMKSSIGYKFYYP
jgi:hypothetical protein